MRDIIGDALWGMMIYWWIAAIAPDARIGLRAATSVVICVAVELSQLVQLPLLDAIRHTMIGHLLLGSGFDARDLLAYAAGVGAAFILERRMTPLT